MTQNSENVPTRSALKSLSQQDFLAFGMEHVAYIRNVTLMNKPLFAIHAADGTPIAMTESEDAALQAISHHDLDAVRLH
jgi:hypothetical protein